MKELLTPINSNDGQFHNGDPRQGTLGTRVTAEWLNDLQDKFRDVGLELHHILSQAGLSPVPSDTTQIYKAIVAIINANRNSGSTTRKGEVQLTDSINMASSVFGASALAVKTAYDKAVTAQNTANAAIPNSKKSSSVSSTSTDTVATSAAAKTAYDKGVEALNKANEGILKNKSRTTSNVDNLLGTNVVWSTESASKETLGFLPEMYEYGVGLSINRGYASQLLYFPHANQSRIPQIWMKSKFSGHEPSRWAKVAMADEVIAKIGGEMTGTLKIRSATETFRVGSWDWSHKIKLSGDSAIGNEVCVIGFNNNGSLHLHGNRNGNWGATFDNNGLNVTKAVSANGNFSTTSLLGRNSYANQILNKAPYYVNTESAAGGNYYYPFLKGKTKNGTVTQMFSFGFESHREANHTGDGIIHLISNANKSQIWRFLDNGDFRALDVITQGNKRLSTAVQRSDFTQNLSANGWCKLPNGLIFQWGTLSNRRANYPIAFRQVFSCQFTATADNDTWNYRIRMSNTLIEVLDGRATSGYFFAVGI